MWHIDNPSKVFEYIAPKAPADFAMNALLLSDKYNRFPEQDRHNLESLDVAGFSITDVKIKSPNNPCRLLDAKLISFRR